MATYDLPQTGETAAGENGFFDWADRLVGGGPDDASLPEAGFDVNVALNRRRLAQWLRKFHSDSDVQDFLALDLLANSIDAGVSSTGLPGSEGMASLTVRPYRLWEYAWIFKCLELGWGRRKVLDLGGPASHLSFLTALAGNNVLSIDINPVIVAAGNEAAGLLGIPDFRAVQGDMRDLSSIPAQSMDIVLCCSVLEHLTAEDQQRSLREIARVLRPSGAVGLTFDLGPAAPGANEHLPPPHEPPSSAAEALERFLAPGLVLLGDVPLDDPIPGSLFRSESVRYTIASLFLGRLPARTVRRPLPVFAKPRLTGELKIRDIALRAFDHTIRGQTAAGAVVARAVAAEEAAGATLARAVVAEQAAAQLREDTRAREQEIAHWRGVAECRSSEVAALQIQIEALEQRTSKTIEQLKSTGDELAVNLRAAQERQVELEGAVSRLMSRQESLSSELAGREATLSQARAALHTLGTESLSVLLRRYLFGRMPDPDRFGLYPLRPLPRTLGGALLAFGHKMLTTAMNSYARSQGTSQIDASRWPRITVVTPVLNGSSYIARAIESVLNQAYPNLEYIIVDGGSSDDTLEIVERYRERLTHVISEADRGMYDALRKGFAIATGEIFCYINSDDTFEPGALQRVGRYFIEHPGTQVVYHEDIVEVSGWRYPNVAQPHVDFRKLLKGHILFQDGVFFRRSAYLSAGGFNPSLTLAGDWDLWIRMARLTGFRRLPGHVSCFYVRSGQLSSRMESYKSELNAARTNLMRALGWPERLRHFARHIANAVAGTFDSRSKDRLFFPIDFAEMPPPSGQSPGAPAVLPVCPITGTSPDRLLFSSRDTRFGHDLINYIYYFPKSHMTVCYPPLDPDYLVDLHNAYYSQAKPVVEFPGPGAGSPYRNWRGPGLVLRFVKNILAPRKLTAIVRLTWEDRSFEELMAILSQSGIRPNQLLDFLDVGCFDGKLLDRLARESTWKCTGIEPNSVAAEKARNKGHEVYDATVVDAALDIPADKRFDVIFLGQVIEHLDDPHVALRRLAGLLRPAGKLVISTPNLDSRQIDLFGPTAAHWHPPFHRFVFSKRALILLAQKLGLRLTAFKTRSNPYWTGMSLYLNSLGLGGVVPHDIELPEGIVDHARSVATWSKLFWDWHGKGDYIIAVFDKGAK